MDVHKDDIFFTDRTRDWCKLPYDGHPKGCPNYNKNPNCPEQTPFKPLLPDELALLLCKFDMKEYIEDMRVKHSDWTKKQLRCVLYWQGAVKKLIKKEIEKLHPNFILGSGSGFNCPSMEAAGINVIKTVKKLGIPIKAKPKDTIYLVSLIGWFEEDWKP